MLVNNKEDGIVITSMTLARKLLKKNYEIIDIRKNRFDRKVPIYIFEYADEIVDILHKYKEEHKNYNYLM